MQRVPSKVQQPGLWTWGRYTSSQVQEVLWKAKPFHGLYQWQTEAAADVKKTYHALMMAAQEHTSVCVCVCLFTYFQCL